MNPPVSAPAEYSQKVAIGNSPFRCAKCSSKLLLRVGWSDALVRHGEFTTILDVHQRGLSPTAIAVDSKQDGEQMHHPGMDSRNYRTQPGRSIDLLANLLKNVCLPIRI